MIIKDKSKVNKYMLTDTSCAADMKKIEMEYEHLTCLICNTDTVKRFRQNLNSVPVTINNKVENGAFYINNFY